MNESTGTMFLATYSAAMLFEQEIKGQLSDGAWENTRPHDHWKFWSDLEVTTNRGQDANCIRFTEKQWERPRKNRYGLSSLYEYVGDRMLQVGRMAKAMNYVARTDLGQAPISVREAYAQSKSAEYMPPTLEEFKAKKTSGKWQYDFVKEYMDSVGERLAEVFYQTSYEMKDLKKDVALIKQAMKSIPAGY